MKKLTSQPGAEIPRAFFQQDPLTCSRELIGCELRWNGCTGIIVETEAYSVINDEACHAFLRPSTRRYMSEHPAGTSYVYLNYGVHWLLNVLVKGGREDGFVLFRALEPTGGIAQMQDRRVMKALPKLCSGPGKLTQALGITGQDHARDLCEQAEIGFRFGVPSAPVLADLRVGISKSALLPWRFLLQGSDCLSVPFGKAKPVIRGGGATRK